MNVSSRTGFFVAGILCVLLTVSLVAVVVNYWGLVDQMGNEISAQNVLIADLNMKIADDNQTISMLEGEVKMQKEEIQNLVSNFSDQIAEMENIVSEGQVQFAVFEDQIQNLNGQIESLTGQANVLEDKIFEYIEMFSLNRSQLHTLVFHVCEKDWIPNPDINGAFTQLVELFGSQYNVLLLPEFHEQQNWTQKLSWVQENFGGIDGIPVMLEVFGSGENTLPAPMLSVNEIEEALAVANVKYLRLFEVISWHIENNQPFPVEYVAEILEFAEENDLKVFWSEWKTDSLPDVAVFNAIANYINGYEDIVTVSFGTNSGEAKPGAGFLQLDEMFVHWGASVQSWYWHTYTGEDPVDMPPSLFVQHTLIAKYVGAELIQFEPYWYFFDNNGHPTEKLELLHAMLVW
ncbi:MAG: hypothetical protein QCH99_10365 [Candidatus Bathyarchaeota archaeon]|nr:hypothetical protein [Candidatus Bathyarchaeum tardum]WGM88695.1 MAG: hypothetical protein NUK63_07165 [Candidatus Bathyarchaeum tardum]